MGRADEPANEAFQTKEYWDERYAAEGPDEDFDWFKTYEDLELVLSELIPDKNARVLMLGCGNSTLSVDMAKHGYANIVNIDYSEVLIDKMQRRYPSLDWRVHDVRQLKELDLEGSFDVVIDKGTMDALMAEKGSVWDPSETVRSNVQAEIDGVVWLLKPRTGVFLYLTWMQPHFRRPYIERPERWSVETRTMGDAFHYFLYIAKML